ncbi:MAG: DUF433 domain-containing protein [Chthoniobacterales bacterium]|nr:DUF433 domain-containing protein [Chthoniobacterales bacterium]
MSGLHDRITIDPEICHGKPCIRGMRYPVEAMRAWNSRGKRWRRAASISRCREVYRRCASAARTGGGYRLWGARAARP